MAFGFCFRKVSNFRNDDSVTNGAGDRKPGTNLSLQRKKSNCQINVIFQKIILFKHASKN